MRFATRLRCVLALLAERAAMLRRSAEDAPRDTEAASIDESLLGEVFTVNEERIVTEINLSIPNAVSPPTTNSSAEMRSPQQPHRRLGLWMCLLVLSSVVFVGGIVIWLTWRDQLPLTAPLFYALPLPLLALSGLVASESSRMLGRRFLARSLLGVVVTITGIWLTEALAWRDEQPPREAIKLLFWNVNRGHLGYALIADEIAARNADVVALVEATGNGQQVEMWRRHLAGYEIHRLGSGMLLAIRGSMLEMEPGRLREALGFRVMRVRLNQGEFALTIVDVASDPLLSRRPAFEKIKELTGRHPKLPHVLVGDFNTPTASPLFDLLPTEYSNAFIKTGVGYRETWPMTSPVLHLDQVWGDSRIAWHRCEHGWSLRSDHRPVTVEFSLK